MIDLAELEPACAQQIRDAQAVASALLGASAALRFETVAAHSNFNYLFRCRHDGDRYYLKVSMDSPKALRGRLPKERILGEAQAILRCAQHAGSAIDVPSVIGVDAQSSSLLMTDVGDGRRNLADVIRERYAFYAQCIGSMAWSIGRCHARSRHSPDSSGLGHEESLRSFAYPALLRGGISALVGDRADSVLRGLENARDCMIHSDLWAKNMLVGDDGRMALLDFEGAMQGDPAFDLATMLAAASIPAFQGSADPEQCEAACSRILDAYAEGIADPSWAGDIAVRLSRTLAVMLAARVAGPFPYPIQTREKEILAELAVSLIDSPVGDAAELLRAIRTHAQRARLH